VIIAQKRLGKLHQAAQTFKVQIERAAEHNYDKIAVAGALYAVHGDILLEWNHIDEAIEHYQRGLNLSKRQNYSAGIAWSLIAMVQARFSQDDLDGAEEALHQLENAIQYQNLPAWTLNWYTAWKARLQITRDDFTGAAKLLGERGITINGNFGYPREVEYLVLARLFIAKENYVDAENLLIRLGEHLKLKGWMDKWIEERILQALVCHFQGRIDQALGLIADVFEIAHPAGYARIFINEGPPMAKLLLQVIEAGIFPEYARHLLTAIPSQTNSDQSAQEFQGGLIDPLSPRELEVIQHLAAGTTNQEIALSLHIALGTVKNHLKKIYGKLGVHNRTQAVTHARVLGLIK
jgi:LuxR family maltose regulon positive regulatory protein